MLLGLPWVDFFLFAVMFGLLIYVLVVNQISNLHKAYLAFHFMMMLWPLSQFIYHVSDESYAKLVAMGTGLSSLLALGPGWLLFTRLFAQKFYTIKPLNTWLALAPVLLMIASMMLWPNLWFHDLLMQGLDNPFGPMFVPYLLLFTIYFSLTFLTLYRGLRKTTKVTSDHRKQLLLLAIGMSIFILCALVDLTVNVIRFDPNAGLFGMTSLGILMSDIFFVVVIQRYRVFEITTLARRDVIDTMEMGIIVVDRRDNVLDLNRGTQGFFPAEKGAQLNMKALINLIPESEEADRVWRAYYDEQQRVIDSEIVVQSGTTGRCKYISLHISPIYDDKRVWVGRLLTFHDISELRHMVEEVNSKNEDLYERNQDLLRIQQELSLANHKLEHLAKTDALTGCYNRRYLVEQMENYIRVKRDMIPPFSLVMFDIDHFKVINDTYGHLVGDEVLCWTTECVRSLLHESDLLARYGGEEFVVFMPGVNEAEAYAFAQRITALLSRSMTEAAFGYSILVTISVGVVSNQSVMKREGEGSVLPSILTLFDAADRLMYHAKESGRNRIKTLSGLETSSIDGRRGMSETSKVTSYAAEE